MGLILIRHTRPDVPSGLCYGRTDVALADTFAEEAARVLAALPEIRVLVTSPLQRCMALAQYIAAAKELPLAVDERLMEMDFGAWQGRHWSDLPMSDLDAWSDDFLHARPHGGESVAMFTSRVGAALAAWSSRQEPVAVVTHAGVIKVACQPESDLPRDFEAPVDFGGIVVLHDADGSADAGRERQLDARSPMSG